MPYTLPLSVRIPKDKLILFFLIKPASYAVDLFRLMASGQGYFPFWLSILVNLVFGIVSFILGTWLFDRKQRK